MGNRITEGEGLSERYKSNNMHLICVTIIYCFNRANTRESYKFTEERACPDTLKTVFTFK